MRIAILTAIVAAFLAAGNLKADEGKNEKQGDRPTSDRRAEFLKKFDKDNSGDLDEEERAAARAEFEKRRGEAGPQRRRGGVDREALLKKFDKDESGDLNEEERAALRKHFEELRAQRGEGEGRGRPAFDREKILAEFDEDKDGKLSEEERTKARATMRERFQQRREQGGEKKEGEGQPRRRRPAE